MDQHNLDRLLDGPRPLAKGPRIDSDSGLISAITVQPTWTPGIDPACVANLSQQDSSFEAIQFGIPGAKENLGLVHTQVSGIPGWAHPGPGLLWTPRAPIEANLFMGGHAIQMLLARTSYLSFNT